MIPSWPLSGASALRGFLHNSGFDPCTGPTRSASQRKLEIERVRNGPSLPAQGR